MYNILRKQMHTDDVTPILYLSPRSLGKFRPFCLTSVLLPSMTNLFVRCHSIFSLFCTIILYCIVLYSVVLYWHFIVLCCVVGYRIVLCKYI